MDSEYRFSLDKSPKKFFCPQCQKKRFVRYMDNETKEYLPNYVGRCDREVRCGYNYTPKQYFQEKPEAKEQLKKSWSNFQENKSTRVEAPPSFIAENVMRQTCKAYEKNHFIQYLESLFHEEITIKLIKRFHIGSSKYWAGATIFWQVDTEGRIRSGKVMLFNPETGSRVKSPYNHINWVHRILEKKGLIKDFNLKQCLFGEDQLIKADDETPIAIVESEKTAILMTVLVPDFIWLACGSLNNLQPKKCLPIAGRKVFLYPDLGAFDQWKAKVSVLQDIGCKVTISDLLERKATPEDRASGYDLADFFIKRNRSFGWAETDDNYPLFWDGIDL